MDSVLAHPALKLQHESLGKLTGDLVGGLPSDDVLGFDEMIRLGLGPTRSRNPLDFHGTVQAAVPRARAPLHKFILKHQEDFRQYRGSSRFDCYSSLPRLSS